jgi:hypothetical protein
VFDEFRHFLSDRLPNNRPLVAKKVDLQHIRKRKHENLHGSQKVDIYLNHQAHALVNNSSMMSEKLCCSQCFNKPLGQTLPRCGFLAIDLHMHIAMPFESPSRIHLRRTIDKATHEEIKGIFQGLLDRTLTIGDPPNYYQIPPKIIWQNPYDNGFNCRVLHRGPSTAYSHAEVFCIRGRFHHRVNIIASDTGTPFRTDWTNGILDDFV